MSTHPLLALCLLVLATTTRASAQKLLVPSAGERQLELVDVAPLLRGSADREQLSAIAAFLRSFATPALDGDDDLVAVGTHHLAVLGSPPQCAWLSGLVAELTTPAADANATDDEAAPATFVDFEVRILRADAAGRAAVLEPAVAAPAPADATAPRARALTAAERTALLAKLAARPDLEQIESPRLLASPLQLAEMSIGRQFAVLRSYRCTAGADGKPIVDPVVEQLVAGNRVVLRAMPLGKAAIGVAATLRHAAVQEPIPETTIDLGTGAPLRVQLPAVTEIEVAHTAAIAKDGALLLLLPLPDGGAIAALVTAHLARD